MNLLKFIRVIDVHDGQLSLTNTALLVVLGKLIVAPALGLTEIGGLFVALLSYQSKKVINNGQIAIQDEQSEAIEAQQTEMQNKIQEVVDQVSALALKVGFQAGSKK